MVRYSPRATRDLAGIADYLVERSPMGARSVERSIRKAMDLINSFPGGGRPLEQRPGVRVMPTARHPYLVFYRISDDELVILHVRHGARKRVDPAEL